MSTVESKQTVTTEVAPAGFSPAVLDRAIEETIRKQTLTWTVSETGETLDLSIAHVRKLFANPTKKGHLPSDKECWLFLHLCKARGLNPYLGDAFLVGYDADEGPTFSLITAHQALLKRAEMSGKKEGMESGVIVIDADGNEHELPGDFHREKDTLAGGWAKVYRSDWKYPAYERLSLKSRQKPYGRWKSDAAGMIVKCAEASAHRMAFPRETGDMYIREEMGTADISVEKQAASIPSDAAETPKTRTEALAASLQSQVSGKVTTGAALETKQEPEEGTKKVANNPPSEPARSDSITTPAPNEIVELDAKTMKPKEPENTKVVLFDSLCARVGDNQELWKKIHQAVEWENPAGARAHFADCSDVRQIKINAWLAEQLSAKEPVKEPAKEHKVDWPTKEDGKVDWKNSRPDQRLAYSLFQIDNILKREADPVRGKTSLEAIESFIIGNKAKKHLTEKGYADFATAIAEAKKKINPPTPEPEEIEFPVEAMELPANEIGLLDSLGVFLQDASAVGRLDEIAKHWEEEKGVSNLSDACYQAGVKAIEARRK